jgi:hypothetical protein
LFEQSLQASHFRKAAAAMRFVLKNVSGRRLGAEGANSESFGAEDHGAEPIFPRLVWIIGLPTAVAD